ncbi:leucine-rich repeat protein, partial [Anaerosporobacter sp.]|uniref:leucine-rich repeat protein n=1 Tax=Anaerosporobacter sp. TaxID=1872529 RepID=UPI00286F3878
YKCTALKKITIGTGLQEIGNHAFCHDKALETIIISSTKLKKLGDHVLYANTKLTIKVPSSKVSAYEKLFTKTAQGKKVVVVKK